MLVLTRRKDEIIYILNEATGDLVTLTILGNSGSQVRVGLDGPQHLKFIRKELFDRTKEPKSGDILPFPEINTVVDRKIHFKSEEDADN